MLAAISNDELITPAMRHRSVLKMVCDKHGVSMAQLFGDSRVWKIVAARRECAEILTTEYRLSSTQIGALMNRHHTSVLGLLGRTTTAMYQNRRRALREKMNERKVTVTGREMLPSRRFHELLDFEYAHSGHTLGIGYFDTEQSRVAELFIDSHKTGSALAANARDGAVVASIALQHGASLLTIHSALNREPTGLDEGDGKAAGVVGAALDCLKINRPELFEPPADLVDDEPYPTPSPSSDGNAEAPMQTQTIETEAAAMPDTAGTLKRLADVLGRTVESFTDGPPAVGPTITIANLRAEIEALKEENAGLHEQIAEQHDEMTALIGEPRLHLKGKGVCPEQLSRVLGKLRDDLMPPEDGMTMPSQFAADADLTVMATRRFRQSRTIRLAADIWGDEAVFDLDERLRRFWEEACELAQSLGMARGDMTSIMREVMGRKPGEPEQEIGGVYFTMLCLCSVHRWSAEELEIREIRRVMAKDPNVMRARHQQKVDAGVAMQAKRPDHWTDGMSTIDLLGGE